MNKGFELEMRLLYYNEAGEPITWCGIGAMKFPEEAFNDLHKTRQRMEMAAIELLGQAARRLEGNDSGDHVFSGEERTAEQLDDISQKLRSGHLEATVRTREEDDGTKYLTIRVCPRESEA